MSGAADTIGVHVTAAMRAVLDDRAAAISISRSKFASLVLDWWDRQGRPPVSAADEAIQRISALRVAEEKGKYRER